MCVPSKLIRAGGEHNSCSAVGVEPPPRHPRSPAPSSRPVAGGRGCILFAAILWSRKLLDLHARPMSHYSSLGGRGCMVLAIDESWLSSDLHARPGPVPLQPPRVGVDAEEQFGIQDWALPAKCDMVSCLVSPDRGSGKTETVSVLQKRNRFASGCRSVVYLRRRWDALISTSALVISPRG